MAEEVFVYVNIVGSGTPMDGVFVGLYLDGDKSLSQFEFTGAGAQDDGQVIFSNVVPGTYELRIVPPSPVSVVGGKVKTIEVLNSPAPPDSNIFDITVSEPTLPVATNTNLCRCSGFFVDLTGRARPDLSIHFNFLKFPQLEYSAGLNYSAKGIATTSITTVTDTNGYAVLDLYRNAQYLVVLEGSEAYSRTIQVPDASSANLPDVLFPWASQVKYYVSDVLITPIDAPTYALAVGDSDELTYSVFLRNGIEADSGEVTFSSSDEDVLEVSCSSGVLTLVGVAAGSAEVLVERAVEDANAIITPNPSVVANLAVTVSA